jgi:AbrB family looped-hinge helix DNA binding protein
MTETVKIKKKFNITIPKKVRKKLELNVGQLVQVNLEGSKIVLKPISIDPSARLEELIGSVKAEQIKQQAEKILLKESKSALAKRLKSR